MPKFIGHTIGGATPLRGDTDGYVLLTYAQAVRLPVRCVRYTLNTTDKGSRGSYAKRWNNYWATPLSIITCRNSTQNMRARALAVINRSIPHA